MIVQDTRAEFNCAIQLPGVGYLNVLLTWVSVMDVERNEADACRCEVKISEKFTMNVYQENQITRQGVCLM